MTKGNCECGRPADVFAVSHGVDLADRYCHGCARANGFTVVDRFAYEAGLWRTLRAIHERRPTDGS